jgi:hypothetical protein
MSLPKRVFWIVFALGLLIGAVIGIVKMVAPDAAHVTLNGAEVTGVKALITSTALGALPGAVLGAIAALVVKIAMKLGGSAKSGA